MNMEFAAVQIGFYFGALLVSHYFRDVFAFGSQNHKRHADHRVRTGGENRELKVLPLDGKFHFCTFAAANPVTLGLFQTLGPIQSVQTFQ